MSEMYGSDRRLEIKEEFDPIGGHIQTIAELHKQAESSVPIHQRKIEEVTAFLGRPRFLFIILAVVVLWGGINIILISFGGLSLDPPPFAWMQGVLTLAALLQTTVILITENRQAVTIERRRQLDLQINLLLDEKMSKLLTMVDEMRRVHPALEDATDPQIEALKKTVDPRQSLETLEQLLNEEEQV
jgi:uncharacterized membrane protein